MSKKTKNKPIAEASGVAVPTAVSDATKASDGKLSTKAYEREIARLHVELAHLQAWVKSSGTRVIIIFEGRDAAGKGGIIRAITERLSPRIFRIAALPAPSDRERTQMYIQRYFRYLPSAGEVVIFDRSWYNRAGVERVMGFCTENQARRFLELCPMVEKVMVESGIILLKYFLTVGEKEQERRFQRRIDDPMRQWKLSPMDVESFGKWWDYTKAYDEMLRVTSSPHAPWWIVPSDDKKRAHINCISHILKSIPYERVKFEKPKLGDRQKRPSDYVEDTTARNYVPDVTGQLAEAKAG
jgi:polyphosphate kinase 2